MDTSFPISLSELRGMARLAARLCLLGILCACALLLVLNLHDRRLRYTPWETDSKLLTMPAATHFKAVMLGSSHAYLFSRFEENHRITERILGGSVANLGMPSGGGLRPGRLMLGEFLARGNRADTVISFADPFVFFSPGPNDQHKFVYFEPLQLRFLWRLIADAYPPRQIFTYVRSKFSHDWFFQHAEPLREHTGAVKPSDVKPELIKKRIDSLYGDGTTESYFARYAREMERIMLLCEAHHMRLVVITPPTLLGEEPGSARMRAWFAEMKPKHQFTYFDYMADMPEPEYYYNLDHLNTRGVEHFLAKFLKPALD